MFRHPFRLGLTLIGSVAVLAATTSAVALGSRAGSSPIESAATKSSTATSVKFDFTLAISGLGTTIPGGQISFGGSGAVDTKHKAADFKLDLSSLAPLLGAATGGAAVPKTIEVVSIGNVIYVDFPALAKSAGAPGKEWVKFDLGKLPKSVTGGVSTKTVSGVSPQDAIKVLRSALTVHKLGSDKYGDHYHATVNLSAFVALVPKSQQASTKASLAKSGIKAVPFDAWIGKAGYLTRIATTLSVKAQKGQPASKIALTVNLHDYNHQVSVHAPPAGKTADGSKLLSSLSGITGG